MFVPVFVCLSVCLLARLLKHACMDLNEMLRVDRRPDAGTGLLSLRSYRLRNFAAFHRLPASCPATRNFTSGKSNVYVLAARH